MINHKMNKKVIQTNTRINDNEFLVSRKGLRLPCVHRDRYPSQNQCDFILRAEKAESTQICVVFRRIHNRLTNETLPKYFTVNTNDQGYNMRTAIIRVNRLYMKGWHRHTTEVHTTGCPYYLHIKSGYRYKLLPESEVHTREFSTSSNLPSCHIPLSQPTTGICNVSDCS